MSLFSSCYAFNTVATSVAGVAMYSIGVPQAAVAFGISAACSAAVVCLDRKDSHSNPPRHTR